MIVVSMATFAITLGAIAETVSASPLQQRSVLCTPAEGVCALGIQTNFDGDQVSSWDLTLYNGACNQIGGTNMKASDGFSSLMSQLPLTVEIRESDPQGYGTKFDYGSLGFGPGNGRNNWGCASCGDAGKSQCCGYYL
jgi:hypothetical protein